MLSGINVVYLLILVAVSLGLIFGLRALQKSVLAELSAALYEENDPARYAEMLDSRFLFLVMRRSTVALLRLDGALFSGSGDAVWEACGILDGIRLKQEERLNWYQKALSFAVTRGDKQNAEIYLTRIDRLLEKEPDESLKAVRADAGRLYGVYIQRDTSLIAEIEGDVASLSGTRLGLELYRLAKLYHYAGDDDKAADALKRAAHELKGSPWLEVAGRALLDPEVLETE